MKRFVFQVLSGLCLRGPLSRVICWRGSRRQPLVALTFDDGPKESFTPRVLDVLREHDTHATFFVLGREVEKCPQLIRRIIEGGHEVGIHGFTHRTTGIRDQVMRCREALGAHGIRTPLFRFPQGAANLSDLLWLHRGGYRTVMWSLDSHDSMRHENKWESAPDYETLQAGDIVLMHDDNEVCIFELPKIIQTIRAKELEPVTVSKLFSC